jgi:hypothetical protein
MDFAELNERLTAARRDGQTWVQIANSLSVSISTLRRLRMKSGFVDSIDDMNSCIANNGVVPADEVIVETLDEMLSLGFTYVAIAKKLGISFSICCCKCNNCLKQM